MKRSYPAVVLVLFLLAAFGMAILPGLEAHARITHRTSEVRGDGGGYTLLPPVWSQGDWWSTHRTAKDMDSSGYEADITDDRTYTYSGLDTIDQNGTTYKCRRLEISGSLNASGKGVTEWNGVPVQYTYTLVAAITGEIYLDDSTLGIVRYAYNVSGTVHAVAVNGLFEEDRAYWTDTYIWYDTPMSFFGFPITLSDTYAYGGTVHAIKRTYTEGENNDEIVTDNYYYDYKDNVNSAKSWATMTMDKGNLGGEEFSTISVTFVDNGGSGNLAYEPPYGGTLTTYYSPATGFFLKQTVTNRYIGENQYTITSEDVLVDYSYTPSCPSIPMVSTNKTTYLTGEGGTCVAEVWDGDGLLDIEHVESDLTQLGLGLVYMVDDGGSGDAVAQDGNFTLTFTVPYATAPGTYTIFVRVVDMEGNTADNSVTINVEASNLPPTLSDIEVSPAQVPNDGTTVATLTCRIGDPDGLGDVASVRADLTALALGTRDMLDDGSHGDGGSNDGVFGIGFSVPPTVPPATYTLIVTATDSTGSSESGSIKVTVVASNHKPNIISVSIEPEDIPNDGTTLANLSVMVSDKDGIGDIKRVSVDLSHIGGGQIDLSYDPGSGAFKGGFTVASSVYPGSYDLDIQAEDKAGGIAQYTLTIDVVEAQYSPEIESIALSKNTVENTGTDSVILSATVSDRNDDVISVSASFEGLEIYLSDDGIGCDSVAGDGVYSGELTVPAGMDPGVREIYVKAVDSKGNTGTSTVEIEICTPDAVDDEGVDGGSGDGVSDSGVTSSGGHGSGGGGGDGVGWGGDNTSNGGDSGNGGKVGGNSPFPGPLLIAVVMAAAVLVRYTLKRV